MSQSTEIFSNVHYTKSHFSTDLLNKPNYELQSVMFCHSIPVCHNLIIIKENSYEYKETDFFVFPSKDSILPSPILKFLFLDYFLPPLWKLLFVKHEYTEHLKIINHDLKKHELSYTSKLKKKKRWVRKISQHTSQVDLMIYNWIRCLYILSPLGVSNFYMKKVNRKNIS